MLGEDQIEDPHEIRVESVAVEETFRVWVGGVMGDGRRVRLLLSSCASGAQGRRSRPLFLMEGARDRAGRKAA